MTQCSLIKFLRILVMTLQVRAGHNNNSSNSKENGDKSSLEWSNSSSMLKERVNQMGWRIC